MYTLLRKTVRVAEGTLCWLGLVGVGQAWASGFRIPEVSVAGLGYANALVANPEALGVLPYNPAAMGFHDGSQLSAGVFAIDPRLRVTTASGEHASGVDTLYAPTLFAMHGAGRWTWGLGVSAPFGLQTRWASGTFPTLSSGPFAVLHPTLSKLEMLNVNPNIAYRLDDATSLAAGVDYYYVDKVVLNSAGVNIDGDGGGYGFNLAALHRAGPWSFGISYRSAIDADIEGRVNAAAARTELNFPWLLQLGVRFKPTAALALEFDVERTGWSRFDAIGINSTASGAELVRSTNGWRDANAYRLGVSYDFMPTVQLRFGYALDRAAQDDTHYNARIPDADRRLFSAGIAYNLQGWTVELGYMHAVFDDRNYRAPAPFGVYGTDPNGTSAYNGDYAARVNIFAVGVAKAF